MSLDKFKKLVDDAAKKKLNFMIRNGSYAHAKILFSKILSEAEGTVSLLTGKCKPDFYGLELVQDSFVNFIGKEKTTLRIIFENAASEECIKDNSFTKALLKKCREMNKTENLKLYRLKDDDEITAQDTKFHFLLADNDGPYRFETHLAKHDSSNSEGVKIEERATDAVANFGNPEKSGVLRKFFDQQVAGNSTEIIFD